MMNTVRQRLAHSIEVSQLASTIGASFGLDRDLVESWCSCARHRTYTIWPRWRTCAKTTYSTVSILLSGASITMSTVLTSSDGSRLHTMFHRRRNSCGLNLVPEVMECVLKHTYCHGGAAFSTEQLLSQTKHPPTIIKRGYCHLEGQAVRIADKISYLVSDLEDGN